MLVMIALTFFIFWCGFLFVCLLVWFDFYFTIKILEGEFISNAG